MIRATTPYLWRHLVVMMCNIEELPRRNNEAVSNIKPSGSIRLHIINNLSETKVLVVKIWHNQLREKQLTHWNWPPWRHQWAISRDPEFCCWLEQSWDHIGSLGKSLGGSSAFYSCAPRCCLSILVPPVEHTREVWHWKLCREWVPAWRQMKRREFQPNVTSRKRTI